ncbi:RecQ family ATP-dependent DNA helicase [Novosphingobium umbonatum]|nr:ATP-dependent DNA helicase RecQ [Novosphingobium umbonatum]
MPELRAALQQHFGHQDFREGQRAVVERMLVGQSTLAVMPTGGGKSLTYQLPAVLLDGVALVISPLIALMQDQMRAAQTHGLRAACLTSAEDNRAEVIRRLQAGALDLLYVAPERAAREDFAALLASVKICLFAIDEAHCVSEWGHDFRPDYRCLRPLLDAHPAPVLALTATADNYTREDILTHFALPPDGMLLSDFDRPNIHYAIRQRRHWQAQVADVLREQRGAGIIYAPTRRQVEQVAQALQNCGRRILAYHAGMGAEQRQASQRAFYASSNAVMVATIAFGMGVDKGDVRFIIHLGLPRSIEAYYQETGRAGRDGAPALALMLWSAKERKASRARIAQASGPRAGVDRLRWAAMERLIGTWGCRRAHLRRYFGEVPPLTCGNCDNCAQARWLVAVVEWAMGLGRKLTRKA